MGTESVAGADRGAAYLDGVKSAPAPTRLFTRMDRLLANAGPILWAIKGMFTHGSLVGITGPPATYKSFLVNDIACCYATGFPWFQKATRCGPVFYLAGEGQRGLSKRCRAWSLYHGISLENVPLFASSHLPLLAADPSAWTHVVSEVDALRDQFEAEPELVIVDTVARAMQGVNENSAEDMSKLIGALDCLRERFGCSVICVHHTGKNPDAGARGSSAFSAALDAEFRVRKMDSTVVLTASKAKDWELAAPMSFRPKLQELDINGEDGRPETSVVLAPADIESEVRAAKERQARELQAQGKSLREIESITGVSKSALGRWLA